MHPPFEKCLLLNTLIEGGAELFHFHKSNPDYRCLGVAAVAESIAEASTEGDDILQRSAEFHADRILCESASVGPEAQEKGPSRGKTETRAGYSE